MSKVKAFIGQILCSSEKDAHVGILCVGQDDKCIINKAIHLTSDDPEELTPVGVTLNGIILSLILLSQIRDNIEIELFVYSHTAAAIINGSYAVYDYKQAKTRLLYKELIETLSIKNIKVSSCLTKQDSSLDKATLMALSNKKELHENSSRT